MGLDMTNVSWVPVPFLKVRFSKLLLISETSKFEGCHEVILLGLHWEFTGALVGFLWEFPSAFTWFSLILYRCLTRVSMVLQWCLNLVSLILHVRLSSPILVILSWCLWFGSAYLLLNLVFIGTTMAFCLDFTCTSVVFDLGFTFALCCPPQIDSELTENVLLKFEW